MNKKQIIAITTKIGKTEIDYLKTALVHLSLTV